LKISLLFVLILAVLHYAVGLPLMAFVIVMVLVLMEVLIVAITPR